jgi:hypothetical protein
LQFQAFEDGREAFDHRIDGPWRCLANERVS